MAGMIFNMMAKVIMMRCTATVEAIQDPAERRCGREILATISETLDVMRGWYLRGVEEALTLRAQWEADGEALFADFMARRNAGKTDE